MLYEQRKHDGSLPIVGVNTFLPDERQPEGSSLELARATEQEKRSQLERVQNFRDRHTAEAQRQLDRLRQAAVNHENLFEVLMDAVRTCSLGQITEAFFEVGGRYRRNV